MKIASIALIFAGASSYKLDQKPVQPVCVYVDKATGFERDCSASGNSAWVDATPYVTIDKNADYHRNFFARYFFMNYGTGNQGYSTANLAYDRVDEIPVINFKSDNDFVGPNVSQQRDKFAMVIDGNFDVPEAGDYTFFTTSDDGSRLYVNGAVIVDNWGLHGVKEKSG